MGQVLHGSAIIDGSDPLHAALADIAAQEGCSLRYRETDPDAFGEELANQTYQDVDRIAIVVGVFQRDGESEQRRSMQ